MNLLISVSGGNDSTATLLLSRERYLEETMAVFADTGNEHPLTYEYPDYLRAKTVLLNVVGLDILLLGTGVQMIGLTLMILHRVIEVISGSVSGKPGLLA